jgi:hypothetical protein
MFTGREWLADVQLYDYRNRLYTRIRAAFCKRIPWVFAAAILLTEPIPLASFGANFQASSEVLAVPS